MFSISGVMRSIYAGIQNQGKWSAKVQIFVCSQRGLGLRRNEKIYMKNCDEFYEDIPEKVGPQTP